MENFSSDCVLVVLASEHYDESDYDKFLEMTNGFIFDIPVYRISPFRTDDVSKNHILFNTDNIKFKTYLNDRFIVTQNGREAIGSIKYR